MDFVLVVFWLEVVVVEDFEGCGLVYEDLWMIVLGCFGYCWIDRV